MACGCCQVASEPGIAQRVPGEYEGCPLANPISLYLVDRAELLRYPEPDDSRREPSTPLRSHAAPHGDAAHHRRGRRADEQRVQAACCRPTRRTLTREIKLLIMAMFIAVRQIGGPVDHDSEVASGLSYCYQPDHPM
jgi:hypothetical protein